MIKFSEVVSFIMVDVWRKTGAEISRSKRFLYSTIKSLILAVRGFSEDRLVVKASALTYYTLFALVPVLALMMAIGRGFGMQEMILGDLTHHVTGHQSTLMVVLGFVDKYLEHARGGVFVGVGVMLLLWSVISCFRHVEKIFNDIWGVKKGRNIVNQFSIYLSMMLILPVLLIASSGLSMFLISTFSDLMFGALSVVLVRFIKLLPYVINILIFMAVFIIVPNTKVKWWSALTSAVLTGIAFQVFQYLYIKGQVFLSSYNVVYGGFAVLPLLLMWLQISWLIVLLGAELSFAMQNFSNYEYDSDLRQMSRRYWNFLALSIMTLVTKRYVNNERAYTSEDISKETQIPIRIVRTAVNKLVDMNLLYAVNSEGEREYQYCPSVDPSMLSIADFFLRIDSYGSDNLCLEEKPVISPIWEVYMGYEKSAENRHLLIKDININEKQ